jgi:hypothetical protein
MIMKANALREYMTPFPSFPQVGEGECDVFMKKVISTMVNALRELQSAGGEERRRLAESMLVLSKSKGPRGRRVEADWRNRNVQQDKNIQMSTLWGIA